jgi:uncharacterized membrane protein
MATIEESIEVNVPVSTAYNQWTQFEEFPRFMDGVDAVRQTDDTHLHWVVSHNGPTSGSRGRQPTASLTPARSRSIGSMTGAARSWCR